MTFYLLIFFHTDIKESADDGGAQIPLYGLLVSIEEKWIDTITEPECDSPNVKLIPSVTTDAKWWQSKHVLGVLADRLVEKSITLLTAQRWSQRRGMLASWQTGWSNGWSLLASSNPARLPCLSSPPSVIGRPQRSPRWERRVSLAGSLQPGPLVPPPRRSLPGLCSPCQVAGSHTRTLMYSL